MTLYKTFLYPRWETTERLLENGTTERRDFVDKWWSGPNGHRWGEKSLTTEIEEVGKEKGKGGNTIKTHVSDQRNMVFHN